MTNIQLVDEWHRRRGRITVPWHHLEDPEIVKAIFTRALVYARTGELGTGQQIFWIAHPDLPLDIDFDWMSPPFYSVCLFAEDQGKWRVEFTRA